MAAIEIPERYKGGLIKLITLSENSVDQIISAFEGVAPKFFPEELSKDVISKIEGVSPDDLLEIISAILILSKHRVHDDIPPEELAEQIVQALSDVKKNQQQGLKRRLVRFFQIETLLISAKASSIMLSHENIFCSARIITDVRPVFGSDPSVTPNAAVTVHMLNLSYHHEGQIKELYIAMDALDIDTLRIALDRADLKGQSLKSLIKRAGLTHLDPLD
jgi:methionine synthase II (cobalamin-independent)